MACGDHLTLAGLEQIKAIKFSMNSYRTDYNLPLGHTYLISPYWLLGFVEGDGSFNYSSGCPRFYISQDKTSIESLRAIVAYFEGLGVKAQIYPSGSSSGKNNSMFKLKVSQIQSISDILIPFFEKLGGFLTSKGIDLQYWKAQVRIHRAGLHNTPEGKQLIAKLCSNMNQRRLTTTHVKTDLIPVPVFITEVANFLAQPPKYQIQEGTSQRSLAASLSHPKRVEIDIYDLKGNLQGHYTSITKPCQALHFDAKTIKRK